MKRFIGVFFGIIGFFLVVSTFIILFVLFQSYRFWLQDAPDDSVAVTIDIDPGTSLSTIADTLDDEGIIASAFWFKVYATFGGHAKAIQSRSFLLTPGDSYAHIADALQIGFREEVTITIPEGYTIAQIGEVVTRQLDVTQEDWDALVGMDSSLESHELITVANKPENVDLEGYLFPDTYRFFSNATAEDVVERLLDEMESHILEIDSKPWPEEMTSYHDILTLASIIQREVQNPDEMAMVADIFLKRLEIGMPLQADSTVNYVTGAKTPAISLTDRDIDSLYNTYQYAGLPPGPLSNPGRDAIDAVLHPIANDYYYFLTTPEGEVIYAVTHDQHVQNKAIYLR